ncbi:unnamed protein product [Pseudo-nitzschia multistriata]|uniref:protein S-acyltransferase n=1 Tax=Pseudo-nitzschia multistriata TaxID=183589 RepID=A0A448ZF68_9STRA|nr:unnamed protein product [Pseudo-nitzschia multistriata]
MALYEVPAVEALPFYHDGFARVPDGDEPERTPRLRQREIGAEEEEDNDSESSSSSATTTENSSHSILETETGIEVEPNPLAGQRQDLNQQDSASERKNTGTATTTTSSRSDNASSPASTSGGHSFPIESLPPLPEPRHSMKREETRMGVCVVVAASILIPFLTHYVALTAILPQQGASGSQSTPAAVVAILVLVYTEAVLALVCTVGILRVDPCVVHRSPETCFPLPLAVESWLMEEAAGAEDEPRRPHGLERYIRTTGVDSNGRRTTGVYCTRCLVWRKPGPNYYHCTICQRCCAHHDHHCNVFGRCIAGKVRFWESDGGSDKAAATGMGNMVFFATLIAVAGWAYLTVCSAFIYACSVRFGARYAVPIGLVAMIVPSCCWCDCGVFRSVWGLFVLVANLVGCCLRCLSRCTSRYSRKQEQEGYSSTALPKSDAGTAGKDCVAGDR